MLKLCVEDEFIANLCFFHLQYGGITNQNDLRGFQARG